MASYSYNPLPEDGQSIRLLRLMPSPHIASEVVCEIFHSKIGDPQVEATPYEALSYTWGDASYTVDIDLSGNTFRATVNLEAALRCLRGRTEPRVFWVDAVCINQQDPREQGSQVRMMWAIYRAASRVIVWLGPEVGDSAMAMDSISRHDAQKKEEARATFRERPAGENDPRWCGCHAGDYAVSPSRIGVRNLLNSTWFTRVWVLQEVAAAKEVLVACGDRTVTGQDFFNELTILGSSWIQKMLRRCRPALDLMNKQATGNKEMAAGSTPLLELIERYRSWDTTKEVDKLFALLAFSSDAAQVPKLQPDYTVSSDVLARRIVEFAFPSSEIDTEASMGTKIVFEVDGMLLGSIESNRKYIDRIFDFKISSGQSKLPSPVWSSKAKELFSHSWEIRISDERKLQLSSSVVLLRGATLPSVVRHKDGNLELEWLATPEPTSEDKKGQGRTTWSKAVEALSNETEGWMRFKLAWDPFSPPDPSAISRFIPTPNHPTIQWEALMESMKDAVDNGAENTHNCKSQSVLSAMFAYDKQAIKAGTSKFTMTLHKAAYNGYFGTVKLLIDANADVNATYEDAGTPLHMAALQGHGKVVKALLDAKASLDVVDGAGRTPLDLAMAGSHFDVAQLLIEAGAFLKMDYDDSDRSPTDQLLDYALSGSTEKVRELLRAGVDPNQTDEVAGIERIGALLIAAEMGHAETVVVLVDGGAHLDTPASTGVTALHQAAMNGHTEVVQVLLHRGANVNPQDEHGATPLDFALHRRKLETARVISSAGGRTNNFRSK